MSANKSRTDTAAPDPSGQTDEHELQGTGTGSASALERLKAEHALRHKRQHGSRTAGPGHEEDHAPDR